MAAQNRNLMLDALRAIACFMVISIHIKFPGTAGLVVASAARIAVPLFLMISGWFSYREDGAAAVTHALRKAKAMARLLGLNVGICLIWNSVNGILKGEAPLAWLQRHMNLTGLRRLVLFHRAHFFTSITYYLLMMLYVYAIYIILVKRGWLRRVYWLAPPALAAAVCLQVRQYPWYYSGNFLLTGLPYFLLGNFLCSRYRNRQLSAGWKWALALVGGGLTCVEASFQLNQYVYFGTAFLTAACLLTAIQWKGPVNAAARLLARFEQRHAVTVFLIHCNVINTLDIFLKEYLLYRWTAPFAVLLISVLISMACIKLREYRNRRKSKDPEAKYGI